MSEPHLGPFGLELCAKDQAMMGMKYMKPDTINLIKPPDQLPLTSVAPVEKEQQFVESKVFETETLTDGSLYIKPHLPEDKNFPKIVEVANEKDAYKDLEVKLSLLVELRHKDKPYHGPEHSKKVTNLVGELYDLAFATNPEMFGNDKTRFDSDKSFARVVALAHDTYQGEIYPKVEYPLAMMQRSSGTEEKPIKQGLREKGATLPAEKISALELEKLMKRYVDSKGQPIFSPARLTELMKLGTDAINATYADFGKDGLYQPHLNPDSPFLAFALAKADIAGPVGAGTAETYQDSGNSLFWEEKYGLTKLINECNGDFDKLYDTLHKHEVNEIASLIYRWKAFQIQFAKTQSELFQKNLDSNQKIPAKLKETLKTKFDQFQNNLAASEKAFQNVVTSLGGPDQIVDVSVSPTQKAYNMLGVFKDEEQSREQQMRKANFKKVLQSVGYMPNKKSA